MKPKPVSQSDPDSVIPFMPTADFKGKPFGPDEPEMSFKAGIMSSPVPVAWIESLSTKKTETAAATAD